jgi:hypothetical protein
VVGDALNATSVLAGDLDAVHDLPLLPLPADVAIEALRRW